MFLYNTTDTECANEATAHVPICILQMVWFCFVSTQNYFLVCIIVKSNPKCQTFMMYKVHKNYLQEHPPQKKKKKSSFHLWKRSRIKSSVK